MTYNQNYFDKVGTYVILYGTNLNFYKIIRSKFFALRFWLFISSVFVLRINFQMDRRMNS